MLICLYCNFYLRWSIRSGLVCIDVITVFSRWFSIICANMDFEDEQWSQNCSKLTRSMRCFWQSQFNACFFVKATRILCIRRNFACDRILVVRTKSWNCKEEQLSKDMNTTIWCIRERHWSTFVKHIVCRRLNSG